MFSKFIGKRIKTAPINKIRHWISGSKNALAIIILVITKCMTKTGSGQVFNGKLFVSIQNSTTDWQSDGSFIPANFFYSNAFTSHTLKMFEIFLWNLDQIRLIVVQLRLYILLLIYCKLIRGIQRSGLSSFDTGKYLFMWKNMSVETFNT